MFDGTLGVLTLESAALQRRHAELRNAGALWDHPEYRPHITVCRQIGNVDPARIAPFFGVILLGPEVFRETTA